MNKLVRNTFPKALLLTTACCTMSSMVGVIAAAPSQPAQPQETTTTTLPEYGLDMSFPHTSIHALSTNYPWLPHNTNPADDPNDNTPNQIPDKYKSMPIQYLGNRMQVYEEYMDGCRKYWEDKLGEGSGGEKNAGVLACDDFEQQRIHQNRDQPISMVVSDRKMLVTSSYDYYYVML